MKKRLIIKEENSEKDEENGEKEVRKGENVYLYEKFAT